jgi:hypothetical protein
MGAVSWNEHDRLLPAMRRVHLRGHTNIRKRLLIHASGFNLGLLMRHLIGVGMPRGLQGRLVAAMAALLVLIRFLWEPMRRPERLARPASRRERRSTAVNLIVPGSVSEMAFTTGSWAVPTPRPFESRSLW